MLVYRVFAYDSGAAPGESGHPDYLHLPAQGSLRLDNPGHYCTWYYGATPEVAIGEVFAGHSVWLEEMFQTPFLPTGRRVLGYYEIDDNIPLLDLDDANSLADRALRPTQVVSRVRPMTQKWALNVFQEANHDGSRKWAGVRWWSYHRPHWTVYGLWANSAAVPPAQFIDYEDLSLSHRVIKSVGATLSKL